MSTQENTTAEEMNFGFGNGFESFQDAETRKAKEEAESGGRPDINYFKTEKVGDYDIKIYPHHPESSAAGSKGFSTPARQAWLKIDKLGADKPLNVKVFDARMCGFENDLLATFKYLAIGKLKDQISKASGKAKEKLEETLKTVDSSGFNGGLRFDYKHLMWVLDMAKRQDGIHLWECSNGVFKSLEETKMKVWAKRAKKDKKAPCPVTGVGPNNIHPANIVIVTKSMNGKKIDYSVMLDLEEDKESFTQEELKALMDAPKLPSFIYYNKRSYQATMIFLEQYDAKYKLGVVASEKFLEVAEEIKAKLEENTDDTSGFDLNADSSNSSDSNDSETASEEGLKLDDLLDEFDEMVADEIQEDDDEMKDFRKKLRKYLKQEGISDIKIGRKDATSDVLTKIEDFIEENGERGIVAAEEMETPEAEEETNSNESEETPEEETQATTTETKEGEPEAEEETPAPTRRRRSAGTSTRRRRSRD